MTAVPQGTWGAVARSQTIGATAESFKNDDRNALAGYLRSRTAAAYGDVIVGGVNLRLELCSPSIGTVVHGLDLAEPLNPEMVAFIRRLWLDRRVIFFRGQAHITRQQHVDLAKQFGVIGAHHGERDWIPDAPITPKDFPDIIKIASSEAYPAAADGWHSDVMWSARPPMGSMLLCREAPPVGGDTSFCDAYAMWEGLSPEVQRKLKNLQALNVGGQNHRVNGEVPSAIHPCVRTHPETGGTTLFVAQGFSREILDVTSEESKALKKSCFRVAGQPEYTCRFKWEVGSLAFWDNRACFHRATADFWPHSRKMERVTVLDHDESRKKPFFQDLMSPAADELHAKL